QEGKAPVAVPPDQLPKDVYPTRIQLPESVVSASRQQVAIPGHRNGFFPLLFDDWDEWPPPPVVCAHQVLSKACALTIQATQQPGGVGAEEGHGDELVPEPPRKARSPPHLLELASARFLPRFGQQHAAGLVPVEEVLEAPVRLAQVVKGGRPL